MDLRPIALRPSFLVRLAFLFERLAERLAIVTAIYPDEGGSVPGPAALAMEQSAQLAKQLDSAVWHLRRGITHSRWSGDAYLDRLMKAPPELRAKALAEHGLTEADYRCWRALYAESSAIVH